MGGVERGRGPGGKGEVTQELPSPKAPHADLYPYIIYGANDKELKYNFTNQNPLMSCNKYAPYNLRKHLIWKENNMVIGELYCLDGVLSTFGYVAQNGPKF